MSLPPSPPSDARLTSAAVRVAIEHPRQPDVVELLTLGSEFALGLYPPENTFLLNVEELERPGVTVYVARDEGGRVLGMAALVPWGTAVTELKRMFVHADARGRGVASSILARAEADARAAGLRQIVLETGTEHHVAQAVYRRNGYVEIPLFGIYIGEPYSVCMAKMLAH
ncbi:putative acetyltransferase [Okibacterium sp. HSC-33S16]|uniref:GNAT family N-acetyltransferase n=1 Tax=Okibacterium sp. HSC-33S16 TaxID=2910965 RepID=UPI00209D2778|nr:GNAT family N-acetyltransferase [Okibacterium sp. HSC-33S16]MCP2031514.1 putative acetyltransferase [Okibacterium sp. HSC-33S16]